MNWFAKLVGPKPLSQSESDFFDACDAFLKGERIWKEAALIKEPGWQESRLEKIKEALKYLDRAIEKGLVEPSVFHHGFDESEHFHFAAVAWMIWNFILKHLRITIGPLKKKPRKGIASNYFRRSWIKKLLFDFEGSLADLNEAVRLSRLENDDNAYWNNCFKSKGFCSQAAYYELWLPTEVEMNVKRTYSSKYIEKELSKIKRRDM